MKASSERPWGFFVAPSKKAMKMASTKRVMARSLAISLKRLLSADPITVVTWFSRLSHGCHAVTSVVSPNATKRRSPTPWDDQAHGPQSNGRLSEQTL